MSRVILAVVDDIFFASKIRGSSQPLGVTVIFVRSIAQLTASLGEKPDLIIVDLHNQKVDPLEVAQNIKSKNESASIRLLGFFSHVERDLQQAAIAAGYDSVVPRSVFSRDLVNILQGKNIQS
ncbi:MAG TPA: response regulator [Pyrinomonadaceae bacterium]